MALSNVLDWLQALPGPGLLAGTGLLLMAEGIVGFVIPGNAALLIAAAAVGSVTDFLVLWAVAVTFSVAGNVVGFEIGRRVGPALRDTRLIRKHGTERWDRATGLLRNHGSGAVFVGRVIPFVRDVVPAVAGTAGVPYRMFLVSVSAGAAVATALPILFVVAVARSMRSTGSVAGAIVGGILVVLIVALKWHKRRIRARAQTSPDNPGADPELEPAD
jgi:membrane-associated protein